MVSKLLKTIEENAMISHGERVMCAVSGGIDSVVLLHVMLALKERLGIEVCAAHLNHMLRGKDSDGDEEFVRMLCERLGVPLVSECADVAQYAEKCGKSTELSAREVRYDFLRRASKKLNADKIATAHNANDNLETMLLNIARGSGSDGLCGIPPKRGNIIRPMISVSRTEIEKYAEDNGLSHRVDRTNDESVYSRNNIRHNAIPALLYANGGAVENALRTARLLRAETDFLRKSALSELARLDKYGNGMIKCSELLGVDDALFGRIAELLAKKAAGSEEYTLEFKHISDVRKLAETADPSAVINLPRRVTARREYGFIIFEKQGKNETPAPKMLSEGETSFGRYTIKMKKICDCGKIHNSVNTFCISCDRIQDGITVRGRKTGDCIKLRGRPRKSLKRLFIDEKIPRNMRDFIPVLCSGENVAAVFGFGVDEEYEARSGTAFFIEINNI